MQNKRIIDCAVNHVQQKELPLQELKGVNFDQIKKEVYLPCELIRMNAQSVAETYIKIE